MQTRRKLSLKLKERAVTDTGGYSPAYPIEFLSKRPIEFDRDAIATNLREHLGRVGVPEEPNAPFMFFLDDFPASSNDDSVSTQLVFLETDRETSPKEYEKVIHQSRSFPGVAEVVNECRYAVLMANFLGSSLDHAVRRKVISNGVAAAVQIMDIDAVYFTPAEQFVSPNGIVARFSDPREIINPRHGFLNVRFYTSASRENELVMDTLGLCALGLTDFQIHFRDLDPTDVAGVMYGLGEYALERGDVIEDGHTVQGLRPEQKWRCRREAALVEPKRAVIDIDPGPPFAAGNRD